MATFDDFDGVPPPLPVTVAVNVTGWPALDGFAEEDTVTALAATTD